MTIYVHSAQDEERTALGRLGGASHEPVAVKMVVKTHGQMKPQTRHVAWPAVSVVARGGVEPPTFHFSGGRSYQLSYLASPLPGPRPETGTQVSLRFQRPRGTLPDRFDGGHVGAGRPGLGAGGGLLRAAVDGTQ